MKAEIRYGKHNVSFYRTNPVRGLLAGRVSIDVFGDNFLPAYTQGDNRDVVATDTMKNFVYAMALDYPGDTHEGFAAFLGRRFLKTYPQMQWLRIQVQEIPFVQHSAKLLSPTDDDYGWVELDIERDGMRALRCGRRNLRLVKLTGSAFKNFARDAYATLPEVSDRPLFIYLDVYWRYQAMADGVGDGKARIDSEAVRKAVIASFDDFVSMSIQHLVYEMGTRLLARFPGMSAAPSRECSRGVGALPAAAQRSHNPRVDRSGRSHDCVQSELISGRTCSPTLGKRRGPEDLRRLRAAAPLAGPAGAGALERRVRLDSAGRPEDRARLREPHELSCCRPAPPLSRRDQRDGGPLSLWLDLIRQQGGTARGKPLRHHRGGARAAGRARPARPLRGRSGDRLQRGLSREALDVAEVGAPLFLAHERRDE